MPDPIKLKITAILPKRLKITAVGAIQVQVIESLEPVFLAWLAGNFGTGVRRSDTHAGKLWEMSVEDDYMYLCVVAGAAGYAQWRKILMFTT